MVFKVFQKLLTFTIINYLFLLLVYLLILKMRTETLLLSDWSMFSSADLSLAAGKIRKNSFVTVGFRYDFTESQAASCMYFQSQNRQFRVFDAGYWNDFHI